MKKLIAAVLAVLCLAGCSAKEEKTEMIGVTVVTESETVETPVEQEITEEAPVQHFEIEIDESEPAEGEASTPAGVPAMPETELLEGLVGDAVGYSLQIPVFADYAAAETMNAFYLELVDGLVDYANGAVNTACIERNCIASVYGEVTHAVLVGDELRVGYQCRVEYSDTEEPVINERTENWNVQTGEVTSEVG